MEEERVTSQGSKRTPLPVEEPAAVTAAPPLGDAVDDPARRFGDYVILGLPAPRHVGGEQDSLLGDHEDGEADDDSSSSSSSSSESESESESSSSSSSDSDGEFEGHGNRVRFWDGDAAGRETDLVARTVTFLGLPTRFASFQGAAGFMRLAAAQGAPGGEDDGHKRAAIVVHYRLTRFSKTRQGGGGLGHGVEVRDFATALHHVRYLVPFPVAAADPASSLRLAGAALAADVYPYRHYVQLQALWSSLVAVLPVYVPPRAARVVVTVDVGVLRRSEDATPERVERMRQALEALARENDGASPMACGLEQHLPAPVCCDDEPSSSGGGGVARPAKRVKRFAGEVCAICHGTLEHGLAAWPRCSHVFHGKCLEQLLVTVQHRCPMCRSTLTI